MVWKKLILELRNWGVLAPLQVTSIFASAPRRKKLARFYLKSEEMFSQEKIKDIMNSRIEHGIYKTSSKFRTITRSPFPDSIIMLCFEKKKKFK